MHIFVLTATYELRVSRKSHLRDHPKPGLALWTTTATPGAKTAQTGKDDLDFLMKSKDSTCHV
jgi:hypothetical protein